MIKPTVTRLKPSVLQCIRDSKRLRLEIGELLDTSERTIFRHLNKNHVYLTLPDVLFHLSNVLKIEVKELTEESAKVGGVRS